MKIRYLLYLILLLIPFSVKALSVDLTCDTDEVVTETIINCTVKALDEKVSGGTGKITINNGTIKEVSKNNCAIGFAKNDSFECVGDLENGSTSLVTYKIIVGDVGKTTVKIDDATVIDKNWNDSKVKAIEKVITVKEKESEIIDNNDEKPKEEHVEDKQEEITEISYDGVGMTDPEVIVTDGNISNEEVVSNNDVNRSTNGSSTANKGNTEASKNDNSKNNSSNVTNNVDVKEEQEEKRDNDFVTPLIFIFVVILIASIIYKTKKY